MVLHKVHHHPTQSQYRRLAIEDPSDCKESNPLNT